MRASDHGVFVSQSQVTSHGIPLFPKLSGYSLVVVNGVLHLDALVLLVLLLELLALLVKVVLSQSDVLLDHLCLAVCFSSSEIKY